MPKAKTICEVEFEKWWEKTVYKIYDPKYIVMLESVWNYSWKTCGDKIMECEEQEAMAPDEIES